MRGSVLLLFAAAAFIVVAMVQASDSFAEGEIYVQVNGVNYQIFTESGNATAVGIAPEGQVPNIVIEDLVEYQGIDYGVNAIADFAFGSDNIVTVTFEGAMIRNIGNYAFEGANIESITVTGTDTSNRYLSEDGILYKRNRLDSNVELTLVRYPAAHASTVYDLTSKVVGFEMGAFEYCSNLTEITFDADVRIPIIPRFSFYQATSLQKIGFDGEYNNLPESVISIEDAAFVGAGLINIKFPENLRSVLMIAFDNCAANKILINDNLSFIADYAFSDCRNLTAFEIAGEYQAGGFSVRDGVLYKSDRSDNGKPILVCYPAGKTGDTFEIPEDVIDMADAAFYGSQHLKSVKLNAHNVNVRTGAFSDCIALETVTLHKNTVIIEEYAFSNCRSLTTVKGWENVVSIGTGAFEGIAMTSLTLPTSVKTVMSYAFMNSKLTEVTIPDTSVEMDRAIFSGCMDLKKITFEGGDMILHEGALDVGNEGDIATVDVYVANGVSIPSNAVDDGYTTLNIIEEGKRPYPYENLIGVFVCVLILLAIFRIIKEV